MSAFEIAPPRTPRLIDVITELRHFALITYAVAPERLAVLLPDGFEPETFTLSDGRQSSLVSAAVFHDFGFHPAIIGWPTFSFEQTNYRAYVRRGEERCVWFFGTALHTPFVLVPRYVWRLPWHYANINISASWDADTCRAYRYTASGHWGKAHLEMVGTTEPTGTLEGFSGDEETALVLTHPLAGYFRRTDGKIGAYKIWHDRLHMSRAIVERARFEVFEHLDLLEPDAQPHSALIQKSTVFIIYLPPSLI